MTNNTNLSIEDLAGLLNFDPSTITTPGQMNLSAYQEGMQAGGGMFPGIGMPNLDGIDTSMFGGNNQQAPGGMSNAWGNVNKSLATIGGLAQAWQGLKQLDLARDQFRFQKGAFNTNLANQAKDVNRRLGDRQKARIGSSRAGAYESVGKYLNKHSVSGDPIS